MNKYRKEFASILNSSDSNLTKSRFKRLFFMSFIIIVVVLPVQIYVLYQNVSFPFSPYSWKTIHGPSWFDVILVPTGGAVYSDRWVHIGTGLAVFVFFGFGRDAIKMYRSWLIQAGFGTIFPGLNDQLPTARKNTTTSAKDGSFVHRARLFFTKRRSVDSSVLSS